jgi:hypothetical protein
MEQGACLMLDAAAVHFWSRGGIYFHSQGCKSTSAAAAEAAHFPALNMEARRFLSLHNIFIARRAHFFISPLQQ